MKYTLSEPAPYSGFAISREFDRSFALFYLLLVLNFFKILSVLFFDEKDSIHSKLDPIISEKSFKFLRIFRDILSVSGAIKIISFPALVFKFQCMKL